MRQVRRRRRSFRRIKIAGAVLLVLLTVLAGWYLGNRGTGGSGLLPETHVLHVMVLGVDRRADDAGRSDTLMIAAFDEEKEKASLLSVPRDTRVAIDGHDYDKINHAYAFGGHELSQKSVENLIGTKIDHYIMIDTKAFERIIDAMGGVDIDVEKRMYYEDPWDDNGGLLIDIWPGQQHMNGNKAIQYVRYRDGEGDIGRIGRQQKFMKAVISHLISPQTIPKLPAIVKEISSAVETDMSVTELLEFANHLKTVHENGVSAQMVPGRPAFYEDISYWVPDIVALRKMMAEDLGIEMTSAIERAAERDAEAYENALPKGIQITGSSEGTGRLEEKKEPQDDTPMKPEEISVLVINSSGINGAGAEVAGILQRKGFIISSVETGKTNSRERTTITTSARNTDLFYGMPFPCLIMNEGGKAQAVVNIGLDYVKQGQ